MKRLTRRALLFQASLGTLGLVIACRKVPTPIPSPVHTPAPGITPSLAPSRTPTPQPLPTRGATLAPTGKAELGIDAIDNCWTRYAQAVSSSFEEQFPLTRIVWKSITPWNDYPSLIARKAAAGDLDILQAPIGLMIRAWARFGLIRPLDSLLIPLTETIGDIFAGAIQACTNDGKLYGIPFVASPGESLLLYNRSLFTSAGLAFPLSTWSLDDLASATLQLDSMNKNSSPDRTGYIPHYDLPGFISPLRTFGTDLLSPEGTNSPDEATLLSVLQWYHSLVYERQLFLKPYEMPGGPLGVFYQQKAAMIRQTFGTLVDLTTSGADWCAAALWPTELQSGTHGAYISGLAHCLASSSPQTSLSIEWCKFISNAENGVRMLNGGCGAPGCRSSSWQDPSVVRRFPISSESSKIASLAKPEPVPWNLRQLEIYRTWRLYSESLWYNRISPQECVTSYVQACQKILKLPALTSQDQLMEETQ